jgi:GT2 family glycosyltransferase
MQRSRFWKTRNLWFDLKRKLKFSLVGADELLDVEGLSLDQADDYAAWLSRRRLGATDIERLRRITALLPNTVVFSILVRSDGAASDSIRKTSESLSAQVYPHWELLESSDVNDAIARATGTFLAIIAPGAVLEQDALLEAALIVNESADADFIYTDEDTLGDDGIYKEPVFKPDWSPDTLLSKPYTGGLAIFRTSVLKEIGTIPDIPPAAQDYEIALRASEIARSIYHIPLVLYHASFGRNDRSAYAAIHKSIEQALERRKDAGRVEMFPGSSETFIVRYAIREPKKVNVIVPTRDKSEYLERCLQSVFTNSRYPNFDVTVVDNKSIEPATKAVFEKWRDRITLLHFNEPFNFARLNNFAVSKTNGEFLLFLNNDTEIVTPDWMEAMVEQAQRPTIGAVGALLLYPEGTVQHVGVVLQLYGLAGHVLRNVPRDSSGYNDWLRTTRNCSAVTAACMMVRRSAFLDVGGFDDELAVAYNDVDLCLKLRQQGLWNIVLPHVVLYHKELVTRGPDDNPIKLRRFVRESELMEARWRISASRDPFYNPNLTLDSEDFSLRI